MPTQPHDRKRGSTSVRSATGAELAGSWHLPPLRVRPLPPGLVCSPAAGHPPPQMVAGGHPVTGLPHRVADLRVHCDAHLLLWHLGDKGDRFPVDLRAVVEVA